LTPRAEKIVSSGPEDKKEILRLLQLLLVCAVNCPSKDSFLKGIQRLNPEVHVNLINVKYENLTVNLIEVN